jgi:host factor-I protein
MSEFNTGLPSVRQIQGYIKDKQEVELKLNTEDILVGKILWLDQNCICIIDRGNQPTMIWHHALVYLKPKV